MNIWQKLRDDLRNIPWTSFSISRNPLRSTIEGLPKPLRHGYLYMIEEATFSTDITNLTDPLEREDTLWRNMKTSLLTTSRNDGQSGDVHPEATCGYCTQGKHNECLGYECACARDAHP